MGEDIAHPPENLRRVPTWYFALALQIPVQIKKYFIFVPLKNITFSPSDLTAAG